MSRPRKPLSREDVERAMRNTKTNRAAARFCRVSYTHYKKYASLYRDKETGKTLYELHWNRGAKGVPKFPLHNANDTRKYKKWREPALIDVLEGRVPVEHYSPQKIKYRLVESGMLSPKCARCGFKEKRAVDEKSPLILTHKNGDKKDFHLDNLEFLSCNCAFLEGGIDSPMSEEFVAKAEDYLDHNGRYDKKVFELDDYQKDFMKSIGLSDDSDESEEDGSEYISRL